MNEFIATFYSHFGALTYCRALEKQDIVAKLMPVPRKVSSSCGTCVYYVHSTGVAVNDCELDAIYVKTNDALVPYRQITPI